MRAVERQVDVQGADVRFPSIGQQETRHPAADYDDLVPELAQDLDELDEHRLRGRHGLGP